MCARALRVASAWYDFGLLTRCSLRRSQTPVCPVGAPRLIRPSGHRGVGADDGRGAPPRPWPAPKTAGTENSSDDSDRAMINVRFRIEASGQTILKRRGYRTSD